MVQRIAPVPESVDGYRDRIVSFLSQRQRQLSTALGKLDPDLLTEVADLILSTLRSGHTVLLAGNGGSAAEAQHFAAELVGRFKYNRAPYAALALTTDSATLTAVANDFGYQDIFVRQIQALGRPGDLLLALSTSGESENLVRAAQVANERGITVVAMTGEHESRLAAAADRTIRAPAADGTVVQELHMVMTHLLCSLVEEELAGV